MPSTAPAQERSSSSAEQFAVEDEVLQEARRQAERLGASPLSPAAGAALRLLAAATSARSVVEVGTGTGVASLWLLRGMDPTGVLTTIDLDPEQQGVARELLTSAGFPTGRVRMISDHPLTVLPRLADGGYDLVLLDALRMAAVTDLPTFIEEGIRLLRPGGVLVLDKPLAAEAEDAGAVHSEGVRDLLAAIAEDERLLPALLPTGAGLLCAVRRD